VSLLNPEHALELTVRLGCPVLCGFCPQNLLEAKGRESQKRLLRVPDLECILTNATRRSRLRVVFAGFSEPFSVRNIRQLLRTCDEHPQVSRISLYTTGEGMSEEDLEFMAKLRKLYPDEKPPGNRYLNFHVRPRFDYSTMKGGRGSVWARLPQIARLFPSARFVCVTKGVAPGTVAQMRREISAWGLRFTTRTLVSRAGNLALQSGEWPREDWSTHPVRCSKVSPSTAMPVVLPDGSTHACCNDYSLELPVGNLLTGTWESLDFSRARALQADPTSQAPCFRGCHLAQSVAGVCGAHAHSNRVWEPA